MGVHRETSDSSGSSRNYTDRVFPFKKSSCNVWILIIQDKALAILEGYDESVKKGLGAFNLDGMMVDMPVVKWAQKTLERAKINTRWFTISKIKI